MHIISILTDVICNNNPQFMIHCYLSIICQFKISLFVFHKPRFLISQAHFLNAVFFKFIKCFLNCSLSLFSISNYPYYLLYILRNYRILLYIFHFYSTDRTTAASKIFILNFV
ncbi:hypothetical protein MSLAZ_1147 [Methanosarcina lacustris Z-7289]|uniref:Uncharacterized protein n=1 Tax=Methanosarcina lacustris Z-7289 TaxID=1434111 RepID=A0A0E3S606_9EURY|nr:hypothetical protein MSLAZ_1147 [Methanosarcina lacustris Z-7289]